MRGVDDDLGEPRLSEIFYPSNDEITKYVELEIRSQRNSGFVLGDDIELISRFDQVANFQLGFSGDKNPATQVVTLLGRFAKTRGCVWP